MGKYYYQKGSRKKLKRYLRLISYFLILVGVSIIAYALFPIISWQIYFQPAFASQNVTLSIPRASLAELAKNSIDTTNYFKAENWFRNFNPNSNQKNQVDTPFYTLSIPAINIENAVVSTVDTDLQKHLINYQGTAIPGENGNAVVFGHSTLPQLFNMKDYKTIFANVYKLKNGDAILTQLNGVTYTYRIFKSIVVDPSDSSALIQDYDNSYLTIVTCTPPGTTWKRLIVRAKLEGI